MNSHDEVEPQLNDAIENALIEIFLHLQAEQSGTPERVLNAVEEVELWARQRHSTWRKEGVAKLGPRRSLDVVANFALGVFLAVIIILPEILGLTCGTGMFP